MLWKQAWAPTVWVLWLHVQGRPLVPEKSTHITPRLWKPLRTETVLIVVASHTWVSACLPTWRQITQTLSIYKVTQFTYTDYSNSEIVLSFKGTEEAVVLFLQKNPFFLVLLKLVAPPGLNIEQYKLLQKRLLGCGFTTKNRA